jgi:hypothetical protein
MRSQDCRAIFFRSAKIPDLIYSLRRSRIVVAPQVRGIGRAVGQQRGELVSQRGSSSHDGRAEALQITPIRATSKSH